MVAHESILDSPQNIVYICILLIHHPFVISLSEKATPESLKTELCPSASEVHT